MRLATSAIAKVHELAGHESPGRDQGVRASLKGRGRQLARPQRQAGALTADVLAVICLTAIQLRLRGRGFEKPEQAAQREKFDVALVAVLSDAELCRSEASSLTVATCSAGTTAATASPWPAPRPTPKPRAPGGHHPRRHEGAGRHPAGSRGRRSGSVRAVGVVDRPAGEGDCQRRWPFRLGVFQRPQRGDGPAHGPERRSHPQD